jgi:hypothetical protein
MGQFGCRCPPLDKQEGPSRFLAGTFGIQVAVACPPLPPASEGQTPVARPTIRYTNLSIQDTALLTATTSLSLQKVLRLFTALLLRPTFLGHCSLKLNPSSHLNRWFYRQKDPTTRAQALTPPSV